VWAIHAVVENNLFERCNGEGELICIKSHRNIVRNNTFKNCLGAVSIRDGNYNSVYSNVFLATDEPRAAGVRIHGKHNAFVNNYLSGIYKPIECCWGETDPPHLEDLTGHGSMTKLAFAYRASYHNLIAHNTFVACDTVFQWTKKRIPMRHVRDKMGNVERHGTLLAERWQQETFRYRNGDFVEPVYPARRWFILNNLIVNTPQLVRVNLARGTPPPAREENFRRQGNVASLTGGELDIGAQRQFAEDELRICELQLTKEMSGLLRPDPESRCLEAAKIDRDAVRKCVDRPEIDALLAATSNAGAQGPALLTVAQVGPRHGHAPVSSDDKN
jgi:hypothetical protein